MLNRRKAMIGWLVYTAAKPIAKRALRQKAKGAIPGTREGRRGPGKGVIFGGLAALAAGLMFWRRGSGGDDTGSSES